MVYQEIFEKLRELFTTFGKEQGFEEWYVVNNDYYIEVNLRKEHALRLYAELPDAYVDIYVVRLENDLQRNDNYGTATDGRLQQININNIYGTEYPHYPGEILGSEEALLYVLNKQIEMVRNNPQVLFDFIAHIDAYTTPEHAKEYARKNIVASIKQAEQEYRAGRIDKKALQIRTEIAINELKKYI